MAKGRRRLARTIALHDQVLATVRALGTCTTQQVVDHLTEACLKGAVGAGITDGGWGWRAKVHEAGGYVPHWGNVYPALVALEKAGELRRDYPLGPVRQGQPVSWAAVNPPPELPPLVTTTGE